MVSSPMPINEISFQNLRAPTTTLQVCPMKMLSGGPDQGSGRGGQCASRCNATSGPSLSGEVEVEIPFKTSSPVEAQRKAV